MRRKQRKPTDEENDSFEPMISENECKNEESNTKENSNTGNNVDEMFNFLSDWGVSRVDICGQSSDTSHDSIVATSDDDSPGRSFNAIGREECDIFSF